MAWKGVWFEAASAEGMDRSPEWLEGLAEPIVYPYAHSFVEGEERRLRQAKDPGRVLADGAWHSVFYSLGHDSTLTGLEDQGCRILNWLFLFFSQDSVHPVSAGFNEIPLVIHEPNPVKAAAMGNAITLLRFLGAHDDQAIAKVLIYPWEILRGGPQFSAREYEKRVLELLHGELFYPDGVSMFDVLDRHDLRSHRKLAPCCESQIGFVRPILEWIDECWPDSPEAGAALMEQLRNSLADEARTWRRERGRKAADKELSG